MKLAQKYPLIDAILPAERSSPPIDIVNVRPDARTVVTEIDLKIVTMLVRVGKFSGLSTENTIKRTTIANKAV